MTYAVTVYERSTIDLSSGLPPILRTCPHAHRTLSGAAKCREKLQDRQKDGTHSAAWHHAEIAHADGSFLTPDESGEVTDIRFGA